MLLRIVLSTFLFFSAYTQADMLSLFSDKEFLPVEQAFPLQFEVSSSQLNASFNTPDGYYLYKHRLYLTQDGETYTATEYSQAALEKEDDSYGKVEVFYKPLDVVFNLSNLKPTRAVLHYQGCADAGLCYSPQRIDIDLSGLTTSDTAAHKPDLTQEVSSISESVNANDTTNTQNTDGWFARKSILQTIGLFFLAGIALTFTPCVLPMVPILTSVVLGEKQRTAKQGFILSSLYVLGMAITFSIAGLSVGLLGAGANLQALMQTPWVLIVFAALFVLLAFSMFGFYSLSLPNSVTQRLDKLSRKQQGGQALGVFVMGALSALVVSPCVSAPLAGALIYLSTTSDALLGGLALLALGLGMGAPLIVLGTTGASILPKAGDWMDKVKDFFGVLLLGVAIWLLARILPENISLLLWGLLALVYAVYLGALEAAIDKGQRILKAFALILLVYAVAALIGFFQGANDPIYPLKTSSSIVETTTATPASVNKFKVVSEVEELDALIANSTQPLMVDVYADWCISCKVMDEEVFQHPQVKTAMQHYQWVKFDITQQTEQQVTWLKKQQLFGPPTILFFAEGSEVPASRLVGEQSLDGFLQHVERLSH